MNLSSVSFVAGVTTLMGALLLAPADGHACQSSPSTGIPFDGPIPLDSRFLIRRDFDGPSLELSALVDGQKQVMPVVRVPALDDNESIWFVPVDALPAETLVRLGFPEEPFRGFEFRTGDTMAGAPQTPENVEVVIREQDAAGCDERYCPGSTRMPCTPCLVQSASLKLPSPISDSPYYEVVARGPDGDFRWVLDRREQETYALAIRDRACVEPEESVMRTGSLDVSVVRLSWAGQRSEAITTNVELRAALPGWLDDPEGGGSGNSGCGHAGGATSSYGLLFALSACCRRARKRLS